MKVQGIDHLEFYVADASRAADELCAAYGFRVHGKGGPETGLAGQRSVLVRLADIQILLTSAVSADHPAAEYVRRHGDGVAIIAFSVDDATAAFDQAVRLGADGVAEPAVYERDFSRVRFATVSGFGDVAHRLVERHGPAEDFAPCAIETWVAPDGVGAEGEDDDVVDTIDHVALCLPTGTLAEVVARYCDVFGFDQIFEERIEVGSQAMDSKVVQCPSGAVTFTMLEPSGSEPGQIDQFLHSHGGAGVQHVAFGTADISTAVRTLQERGVRFLTTPPAYYDALQRRLGVAEIPVQQLRDLNVLADRDSWGMMFQIFTQSVHPRRTLFFELIERRGALTFGSRNIRALYEAVERERVAVSPQPDPRTGPGATPAHA